MTGSKTGSTIRWLMVLSCLTLAACGSTRGNEPRSALGPEEQVERWEAYRTPGLHQERMARHVGTWTWVGEIWTSPGAEPAPCEGRSVFEMGLDGRFLLESASGSMADVPYFGEGRLGYDNASGEHQSFWIDNLGTGMVLFRGRCSGKCELITYHGEVVDPITGRPEPIKLVYRRVDDTSFRVETWSEPSDGPATKTMEVVYTRS